jgi:hypothetical protein
MFWKLDEVGFIGREENFLFLFFADGYIPLRFWLSCLKYIKIIQAWLFFLPTIRNLLFIVKKHETQEGKLNHTTSVLLCHCLLAFFDRGLTVLNKLLRRNLQLTIYWCTFSCTFLCHFVKKTYLKIILSQLKEKLLLRKIKK